MKAKKTSEAELDYKTKCKEVEKSTKEAILSFESDLATRSKNDPKLVYSYVKSKQDVKEHVRAVLNEKKELVTDRRGIADVLNNQFGSVFVVEPKVSDSELPVFDTRTNSKFGAEDILSSLTREEIETRLNKLNSHKTGGTDEVNPLVLKMCAKAWSVPLYIIFRKSLSEGLVPDKWKEANITPIFKKGSRIEAVNYRPVSLTSVVCKILEGVIRDRLMNFLVEGKLISKDQHGFVRKKACVTNLLESLDLVSTKLAEGECVDIVFLDFLKAFDMVPHRRLLKKLSGYGIVGSLHSWFQSFLVGRKQRVVLGDCQSDWCDVLSGVPQGSVLGPLFFVLYINDLPERVSCGCKMYADDSKLISVVRDGFNALQKDIDAVTDWTKDWLMRLNAGKCKVMHLGNKNQEQNYEVEDVSSGLKKTMEKTTKEKDQGVLITPDLKWADHVNQASAKANRVLGMLKKTFVSRDVELWKKLYTSLVRPHLEFAVQVWNPYMEKDIKTIEKVQERAARIPDEMKRLEGYEERLKVWGIPKLSERRVKGDLIQMYKEINDLEDINWTRDPKQNFTKNPYEKRENFGNRFSMSKERFPAKIANDHCHFVNVRHKFFSNRVTDHWNSLNNYDVDAPTLNSFKARLDKNFKTNGRYSSSELR